jgi:hypothetical protein
MRKIAALIKVIEGLRAWAKLSVYTPLAVDFRLRPNRSIS